MCLAQGPQRSDAGEAETFGLESSTLPLSPHHKINVFGNYCIHNNILVQHKKIHPEINENWDVKSQIKLTKYMEIYL